MTSSTTFAGLLEAFFTDRLLRQRHVSPHTIVSYRDTCRQLLRFAQDRLTTPPSFLDHTEQARGLSARSRNGRLAAIRSFFRYVALEEPTRSAVIQRVLAMPNKKFAKRQVNYLTRLDVEALLAVPDRHTRAGGATTRCSWSPSRPACAARSWPASGSRMWSSDTAPTCDAAEQGERTMHASAPRDRRASSHLAS